MATLKGQNLRIYTVSGNSAQVVGMATSCTITLTNNLEDVSTKDDVGMTSKNKVLTRSWQVQVESLDVSDTAALLTAVKNMQKFTLMWDEASTTDNQTAQHADYAMRGDAYLTDATFTFNDRENSTKSLQFVGAAPVRLVTTPPESTVVSPGSYTKGQSVRLFLTHIDDLDNTTPNSVVAFAKQLQFHVSVTMEDASTKDTVGDFQTQEPVAISFDISSTALVRSGETITSAVVGNDLYGMEFLCGLEDQFAFAIANVSGTNNRYKGTVIVSGSVVMSQLTINAANKTNATYTAQMQGYGAYTVGA